MRVFLLILFFSFNCYFLQGKCFIPPKICFDVERPVDKTERVTVSKKLAGNFLSEEYDILFSQLPSEVQQVIKATSGGRYLDAKFAKWVTLTLDPKSSNTSVKSYLYKPIVFDERLNGDTLAPESWIFKRQDSILKVDRIELE